MTDAITIDLFSDTVTKPTQEMRHAMAVAEVGDEQLGEDPTTLKLEQRVAQLLGKPAAVLLPTGAMANVISFCVHCRPGDEVILHSRSHPADYESAGASGIAGVQLRLVEAERGIFSADQVRSAIRPLDRHNPRSRLVSIEQPTNYGGGACWPVSTMHEVSDVAHDAGLAVHIDGARLLNASVASGTSCADFAAVADSVWIDLSKGLGAPMGAVLAGSEEFIEEAWRVKQRLGGSMRQSGIIAAAGLYALDNHVERLSEDHVNAKRFAELVASIPGVNLKASDVETNIVVLHLDETLPTYDVVLETLRQEFGVRLSPMGIRTLRAVTHIGISSEDIERAAYALRNVLTQTVAR